MKDKTPNWYHGNYVVLSLYSLVSTNFNLLNEILGVIKSSSVLKTRDNELPQNLPHKSMFQEGKISL